MVEAVTLTPTEVFKLNHTLQVDINDAPLTNPDPSYGAPVYVSSDPSVAVIEAIRGNPIESGPFIVPVGVAGTCVVTGTETSTDPTKKVLTGTINITCTAPVADSLDIKGLVE